MKSVLTSVAVSLALATMASWAVAAEQTWDVRADLSQASNPNGTWSFGRKWDINAGAFDLFAHRWHNVSAGGVGWYLGGSVWQPSVMDGPSPGTLYGPSLWPNNNVNGYPTVRWTSPEAGYYDVSASFWNFPNWTGVNVGYIVIANQIVFSGQFDSNSQASFASQAPLHIPQGAYVDFVGANTISADWIEVSAVITSVPEPTTVMLLLLGGLAVVVRMDMVRRRHS